MLVGYQYMCETWSSYPRSILKGNFVVQISAHKFSLIGKDQFHEQSNKNLQVHGGALGRF